MRVVHVIPGLTPGGAESVLYKLVTSSAFAEHEVICLESRDWYSNRLEEHGIRVHHLNWGSVGSARALIKLHRLLRSIDCDVIQTWMYRANLFGGICGRIVGKPVIWNIRSTRYDLLRPATRVLAYLGGIFARWLADAVINCSSASGEVHARLGYGAVPTIIIPNGYDLRSAADEGGGFNPSIRAIDASESFVIGTVGRWDVHKGYPVLLRACGLLKAKGIPLRLVLVGRNLDRSNSELVEIVADSCFSGDVDLVGHLADISEIAGHFDLHVLASLSEGFPNVLAETMLAGVPNVTTDVGDAKLIAGDTGWVVHPGDAQGMAAAIEAAYLEWAHSPEKWLERRRAAHARIGGTFPLRRMIEDYNRIWEWAAAGAIREPKQSHAGEGDGSATSAGKPAPLRILHVINSMTLGGAETLLYRLVTHDKTNHHFVVSLGKPAWYSDLVQASGVEIRHLHMHSPVRIIAGALELRRIANRCNADVIQCWMYRSNIVGGVVGKVSGKPVVWGIHCSSLDPLSFYSRALVYLSGFLARWVPDFIINCSKQSQELHRRIGYAAARGRVIHNGYDACSFYPDNVARQSARERLGLRPDQFVLGSIARWNRQKDIPNLLAAVKILRCEGIELQCLLLGAELDSNNSGLASVIQKAQCEDVVVPLGPRSDIVDIARALDLHVLASCGAEAFPNVVAETMLSGTPNVVTNVGDAGLIVGETGWVVPPRDPEQLASAIRTAYKEWSASEKLWQKRKHAARARIASEFSFNKMADAYADVWKRITALHLNRS